MNDDELMPPPLDADLARLVSAERQRGPADVESGAQNEVLARLDAILGPDGGEGGDDSSGGTPGAPPSPTTGTPSTGGLLRDLQRFAMSRAGAVALGTFVAGAAGGAWLRGEVSPKIVYVDRVVPSSSSSPVQAPEKQTHDTPPTTSGVAIDALPSVVVPRPVLSSSPRAPAASASVDAKPVVTPRDPTSLGAERALVETGRMALARGDHANALTALNRHASEFPNGQLAEEREVLAVRALVASQRKQEAAERAARFRLKYPGSVLLPVVDEALR